MENKIVISIIITLVLIRYLIIKENFIESVKFPLKKIYFNVILKKELNDFGENKKNTKKRIIVLNYIVPSILFCINVYKKSVNFIKNINKKINNYFKRKFF